MEYFLGTQNIKGFPLLLRWSADTGIHRYNFQKKLWVRDSYYAIIFTGELEVDTISQEKANDIISRH